MINTLEEILEEFFYDWEEREPCPLRTDYCYDHVAFGINKTTVYCQDEEYYLSYKTSVTPVSKEAFDDCRKLMIVVENSIAVQKQMNEFANIWMDNGLEENQEYKDLMSYIRKL